MKKLAFLALFLPIRAYPLTVSLGIDAAFSSSFSDTHPAHAGAYGLRAEFQAGRDGSPIFFYGQIYLDYQFHQINSHNIDFSYGDILQTGLSLGFGGEVFRNSLLRLRLNLALTGLGLTYNPRFDSYGMHGRTLLALHMDFTLSPAWGLRVNPYFGIAYQYLGYKGQAAQLGSILLGITLGFTFDSAPKHKGK